MNFRSILRRVRTAFNQWITMPEYVYLAIALVSVIGFVFITPPFQGPDEEAHYVRAQFIAHGYVIPIDVTNTDVSLPKSIDDMTVKTFYDDDIRGKTSEKYELYRTKDALRAELNDGRTYQPLMVAYSPVPYIPAVIGIFIANLFNINPLISLYIARILLAVTSVIIIFFAIRLIPQKKYLLVAVGLIPMLLFQQSVVTADSISYALLALFVSYLLYLRQKVNINKKQWLVLAAVCIGIVLAKPLVFLFLPLILLLSKGNIKWVAVISLLCVVTLLSWLILTTPKAGVAVESSLPNGANNQQQLSGLFSHPLRVLRVGWNSYMTPYGDDQVRGIIGNFGAADTYYPLWMSAGYVVLLGLLSVINIETKRRSILIEKKWKWLAIILSAGYFVAINLALYLGYTPINFDIVYGVQGRYFLPLLIVGATFIFTGGSRISQADIPKFRRWIVITMIALVFLALFITYQRYYLYTP